MCFGMNLDTNKIRQTILFLFWLKR